MNNSFIEKLIARLDRIEPGKVETFFVDLLREKGFLQQVFESLHEGVIILDSNGAISFLNQAATRFFGIPKNSSGDQLNSHIRGLNWKELTQNEASTNRDLEVFYPENRLLNFYLSPITTTQAHKDKRQKQKNGWVMLIRDITQSRAEAARTLEQEQLSAITLLASGVAHEIGNPLNSLNIHLQLLERQMSKLSQKEQASLKEHLKTAQQEIERLDHILKDFLQAIRPTSPSVSKRLPRQLNDLLKKTLQSLEPELAASKTNVHLHLDKSLPLLPLDSTQIQQAIFNLIRNAHQALPAENGQITLTTTHSDHQITLTIQDNGKGIPPELMGTLYQPFQTTKKTGNGLGLLIVRRIIREHGGQLHLQSTPPQGTTVTITLPRHDQRTKLLPNPNDPTIEI